MNVMVAVSSHRFCALIRVFLGLVAQGSESRSSLPRSSTRNSYPMVLRCPRRSLRRYGRAALQRVVSPAEFIPPAEETGLIVPIDHWMISRVCNQPLSTLTSISTWVMFLEQVQVSCKFNLIEQGTGFYYDSLSLKSYRGARHERG